MMKKFLPALAIAMALTSPALARDNDHNNRHDRGRNHGHHQQHRPVIVKKQPVVSFYFGPPVRYYNPYPVYYHPRPVYYQNLVPVHYHYGFVQPCYNRH